MNVLLVSMVRLLVGKGCLLYVVLTEPGKNNNPLCNPELGLSSATVAIFEVLLLCKQVKNETKTSFHLIPLGMCFQNRI